MGGRRTTNRIPNLLSREKRRKPTHGRRGGEHLRYSLMKTSPWHSIKQTVHHDNTDCNTGNNIEVENRRSGTGGKPLCAECRRL